MPVSGDELGIDVAFCATPRSFALELKFEIGFGALSECLNLSITIFVSFEKSSSREVHGAERSSSRFGAEKVSKTIGFHDRLPSFAEWGGGGAGAHGASATAIPVPSKATTAPTSALP